MIETTLSKPALSLATAFSEKLGSGVRRWLILGIFTLLIRATALGYPDYHADETFYLLVGDAMRHGALPYVTIWDRKPLGLFLFYELLAAISPTVWSYQIAAIAFVTATAVLVTKIARNWSSETGAILAGVLYVAWLQPLIGGGGQAPVFYNLFVVGALALLVDETLSEGKAVSAPRALAAATLCGIAVWFKPTALFEGAFIVLSFSWLAWRRDRATSKALVLLAGMVTLAGVPTLSGFAWYAMHGHLEAMWQATVLSNFHKSRSTQFIFIHTVRYLIVLTLLLWGSALLGLNRAFEEKVDPRFARLVLGWLIAALSGFLAVPNFYSHYALPLVPVLTVCAAPILGRRPIGPLLALATLAWTIWLGHAFDVSRAQEASARFSRMTSAIRANMPNNRLYIFNGSSWIYHETGARQVSRFVFPEHLGMRTEEAAIGINSTEEVRRILAEKPDVILLQDNMGPDYNRETLPLVISTVENNYKFVCSLPGRDFEQEFHYFIFARSENPDRSFCPSHETGPFRLHVPGKSEKDYKWL